MPELTPEDAIERLRTTTCDARPMPRINGVCRRCGRRTVGKVIVSARTEDHQRTYSQSVSVGRAVCAPCLVDLFEMLRNLLFEEIDNDYAARQ